MTSLRNNKTMPTPSSAILDWGSISAFMVAKKVEIITKSYREGAQAVKWTCDGSPEFTIEDTDKAERGTDIVFT